LLNSKDENDWQAIHEAVRGGHTDIVKYLVKVFI
jgi:ankyrin repeat protein